MNAINVDIVRLGELAVLVPALDPGDTETVRRGPDDAGDIDRDLLSANPGEGVVGSRIVVERHRATVGREVIGARPVLPDDDGVRRDRADLLDEAREMKGDLRIGPTIVGDSRRDHLRLSDVRNGMNAVAGISPSCESAPPKPRRS